MYNLDMYKFDWAQFFFQNLLSLPITSDLFLLFWRQWICVSIPTAIPSDLLELWDAKHAVAIFRHPSSSIRTTSWMDTKTIWGFERPSTVSMVHNWPKILKRFERHALDLHPTKYFWNVVDLCWIEWNRAISWKGLSPEFQNPGSDCYVREAACFSPTLLFIFYIVVIFYILMIFVT